MLVAKYRGSLSLLRLGSVAVRSVSQTSHDAPSNEQLSLFVNGKAISVEKGTTIMQACQEAGFKIPHFCYHARLAVAGNCRMCLVEVQGTAKPIASCAMSVAPNMKVLTDSPMAKKAREGILEFILANHPLDCPICDQAGECDLQDLSLCYGNDRSRFTDIRYSGKRSVIDKNLGPLIKTSFTKCIHCTRCVRFANEVAGIPSLGTTGRGNNTQIGTYIDKLFMSELSGNVIDLCPVGALTSKPYAFTARPWETRKTESIDVMDSLGSNITVYSRSGQLLRILPRLNEDINEEWISDKARFSYDGLSQQRLVSPMIRLKNKSLTDCDWPTVLSFLSNEIKSTQSASAVIGDLTDCETIVAIKDFLKLMFNTPSQVYIEQNLYSSIVPKQRSTYLFNSSISAIEQSDLIVLINVNPRYEAPLVNARIRKAWRNNERLTVCNVGPANLDLTYDCVHLGDNPSTIESMCNRTHSIFNQLVRSSTNPMVIVGTSDQSFSNDLIHSNSMRLSKMLQSRVKDSEWRVFNLLHQHCSTVGALDLGCSVHFDKLVNGESKPDIVFLFNCDSGRLSRENLSENCLIVYIGHHGDNGAQIADFILPGCAYTEKNATFVNTEGRVQMTRKAISPPGIARDDWKIIRALSEVCKCTLPYDDHVGVTRRLIEENPIFAFLNNLNHQDDYFKRDLNPTEFKKSTAAIKKSSNQPIKLPLMNLSDYWMTNTITRSSAVMAQCVRACRNNLNNEIDNQSLLTN